MESRAGNSKPRERITFVATANTAELLEKLRIETDSINNADVIKRALNLLYLAIIRETEGDKLCLQDKNGKLTAIKLI